MEYPKSHLTLILTPMPGRNVCYLLQMADWYIWETYLIRNNVAEWIRTFIKLDFLMIICYSIPILLKDNGTCGLTPLFATESIEGE